MNEIHPNQILMDYNSTRVTKVEPWFIYHQIFRNQKEYYFSSMRARASRGLNKPINDNRKVYSMHTDGIKDDILLATLLFA